LLEKQDTEQGHANVLRNALLL